jgi:hypothetical protein
LDFPAPETVPWRVAKPSRGGGTEEKFQTTKTRPRRRVSCVIFLKDRHFFNDFKLLAPAGHRIGESARPPRPRLWGLAVAPWIGPARPSFSPAGHIAFEVYVPAGFDGVCRTAAPRPLPTSSGAGRRTRRFAPTRGSCAARSVLDAARVDDRAAIAVANISNCSGCTDGVRPSAPAKELAEGSIIRPNRIGAA